MKGLMLPVAGALLLVGCAPDQAVKRTADSVEIHGTTLQSGMKTLVQLRNMQYDADRLYVSMLNQWAALDKAEATSIRRELKIRGKNRTLEILAELQSAQPEPLPLPAPHSQLSKLNYSTASLKAVIDSTKAIASNYDLEQQTAFIKDYYSQVAKELRCQSQEPVAAKSGATVPQRDATGNCSAESSETPKN